MTNPSRQRALLRIAIVSLAVVVAMVGVFGVVAYSCAKIAHSVDGMCGNKTLAESLSPDGRYKVVVFERDCGATTDFSTQASIVDSHVALPNEAGNVFIAKTGGAPSGQGGGPELRVRWLDARRVVLSHHEGAVVFSAVREHDGVQIAYEIFR